MNVVEIGGGGGLPQILQGMKTLKNIVSTAIVTAADNGKSTGAIRREYPEQIGDIGDLTKNVAALCPDEKFAKAMCYRFQDGFLGKEKHSVKNLFYLGLRKANDNDLVASLEQLWWVFRIEPHRVLPVADQPADLVAKLSGGMTVKYEAIIDTLADHDLYHESVHQIEEISLDPLVHIWAMPRKAIIKADWVLIAPGDLSTILSVLSPRGMRETFKASRAKIAVMLNLMTRRGQTNGFSGEDFMDMIKDKIGKSPDRIIIDDSRIPDAILARYKKEHKIQLTSNLASLNGSHPWLVRAPFAKVTDQGHLIHDPEVVASVFRQQFSAAGTP
jgi:uncharacterized cofD-like protein